MFAAQGPSSISAVAELVTSFNTLDVVYRFYVLSLPFVCWYILTACLLKVLFNDTDYYLFGANKAKPNHKVNTHD